MMSMFNVLANWPAPSHIGALTTTRYGLGRSHSPYDNYNLALHVGDNTEHVLANRAILQENLQLPAEPVWLQQHHSTEVIVVENEDNRHVDAAITQDCRYPLVIMTADCLPILLCDKKGQEIAAIHAGWRGLVGGIVEQTVAKMKAPPSNLMAWVGPAICGACYEVGQEVCDAFLTNYRFAAQGLNRVGEKPRANLPLLARLILQHVGVLDVYHANLCTYELKNTFYSYRRQSQTGRMGTFIWFKKGVNHDA